MSQRNILVLGCGWVGEELVKRHVRLGDRIWATTTNEEKRRRLLDDGVEAITHDFDAEQELLISHQVHFDFVVVSVPATRRLSVEEVKQRFGRIREALSGLDYGKMLFLSSVGIYPDLTGRYDESYSERSLMDANLYAAEIRLQKLPNTIVFRLGGLFGKDRIFAKYFQNRVCQTGEQLANFVHLDDVLNLMEKVSNIDIPLGVYNVVAPVHPTKKEVILASAKRYHFDVPSRFESKNDFKKYVTSEKIINLLNYDFKYPSPLGF